MLNNIPVVGSLAWCAYLHSVCDLKASQMNVKQVRTWLLKRVRSVFKNLDNQAKLGRPKTVDSKAVFQAIEASPAIKYWESIWWASYLTVQRGSSTSRPSELPNCASHYKTFNTQVFTQLPCHEQDVTQSQFLSKALLVWLQIFASLRKKNEYSLLFTT